MSEAPTLKSRLIFTTDGCEYNVADLSPSDAKTLITRQKKQLKELEELNDGVNLDVVTAEITERQATLATFVVAVNDAQKKAAKAD